MFEAEGVDALLRRKHSEMDAAAHPVPTEARPSASGGRHGALLTEDAGVSARLGAGACWSPSVPRAAAIVLDERGRLVLSRGQAVTSGSESVVTGSVRETASELSSRALPLHST